MYWRIIIPSNIYDICCYNFQANLLHTPSTQKIYTSCFINVLYKDESKLTHVECLYKQKVPCSCMALGTHICIYCGVRAASGSSSKSQGLRRLTRGFSSARCPVSDCTSRSTVRYTLDLPQSSSSLSAGRSTASPTTESSTTAVQVHCGGSNPLSFLSSRRRESTLTLSRSVCRLSNRPSLAGTPRSGASDGSTLVCLHRDPH